MARPRKKADWYQHFNDMQNDPRVRALRRKFGNNGYSILNYLMENICKTDQLVLEFDSKKRLLYAAEYDVTQDNLEDIVNFCVDLELLEYIDDEQCGLISPYLNECLKLLFEKREKDRQRKMAQNNKEFSTENPEYSAENNTNNFPQKTTCIPRKIPSIPRKSTHNIVKKTKVKHSSSADIRARESKQVEVLSKENRRVFESVDDEVKLLLEDAEWKRQVFSRFSWFNDEESALQQYLIRWAKETKARGRGHKNLGDAKEHLKNWMIIQEDKLNLNSQNYGTENSNNGYRTAEEIDAETLELIAEIESSGAKPASTLPVV